MAGPPERTGSSVLRWGPLGSLGSRAHLSIASSSLYRLLVSLSPPRLSIASSSLYRLLVSLSPPRREDQAGWEGLRSGGASQSRAVYAARALCGRLPERRAWWC